MGHGRRLARAAVPIRQKIPAHRAEESDGLLRARALPKPRSHDRRVDDDLRDAPDAQPAAGCCGAGGLGRSFAVTAEPPVTYVETQLRQRRRLLLPVVIVLALCALIGLVVVVLGLVAAMRLTVNRTEAFPDIVAHFEHGSIGADQSSGIPFWVWQALPRLFPVEFDGRLDYRAFGFLYNTDARGRQEPLPIGISKRDFHGVDLVWFNCAVCPTGASRASQGPARVMGPGLAVKQPQPLRIHPIRSRRRRRRALEAGSADSGDAGGWRESRCHRPAGLETRCHPADARRLHRATLAPSAVPRRPAAVGAG